MGLDGTVVVSEHTVGNAPARAPARLIEGTSIGRFVILGELGAGAMGVVYRAYDPSLRREVALKLLRPELLDAQLEARLMSEAQSMAQLSHHNVVSVYDVTAGGGRFVIAMEYVPGTTLREWLAERPRPWRAIVAAFGAAGAGLMAAHRVGLIHRDFKPANVLMSADGVVKVADFGIAKAVGEAGEVDRALPPLASMPSSLPAGPSSRSSSLAATGSDFVIGTPRYMAPEQHASQPVDARADQFSFCAALWEALAGVPPYTANTELGLELEKRRGPPSWVGGPRVPRRVVAALRRGLQPEPSDRFPTMEALLLALAVDGMVSRSRAVALLALPTLLLGSGFLWTWHSERALRCSGANEHLTQAWGESQRRRVQEAFVATALPLAEQSHAAIIARLDTYVDIWGQQYRSACEATVAGQQSEHELDLRVGCLRRASFELEATVDVLARADAQIVEHAGDLLAGLPPLRRCEDLDALAAEVPPPVDAEARRVVDRVRSILADAQVQERAAKFTDALARVDEAASISSDVGYGPIRAELELRRGSVLQLGGRLGEAKEALSRALQEALGQGMREVSVRAAGKLSHLLGELEGHPEEALQMAKFSLASVGNDPLLEAESRNNLGTIYEGLFDLERAEAEYRSAIALAEAGAGENSPVATAARNNLAVLLDQLGRFDDAVREHRRNLSLWTDTLGAEHPQIAAAHCNIGAAYFGRGQYEEAEQEFRVALAILEKAFGREHPEVAHTVNALGIMLMNRGQHAAAELEFSRALSIRERLLGPEHRDSIWTRLNLVGVLLELGRFAEGEAEARKAIAAARQHESFNPVSMAKLHQALGTALEKQERYADAELQYREALDLMGPAIGLNNGVAATAFIALAGVHVKNGRLEDAYQCLLQAVAGAESHWGRAHLVTANGYRDLAEVLAMLGKRREALEAAQIAWTSYSSGEAVPAEIGRSAFTLAKLLWPDDPVQARALGRRAQKAFEIAGEQDHALLREVQRWLRSR